MMDIFEGFGAQKAIASCFVAASRKHRTVVSAPYGDGISPRDAQAKARNALISRMAWLDEQDHEFRALVHDVGLNKACQKTGRRVPG